MSFVFPVLLGGVLLAGIPVLLHLIMRRKPKTLLFPAFRFLLVRHKKNHGVFAAATEEVLMSLSRFAPRRDAPEMDEMRFIPCHVCGFCEMHLGRRKRLGRKFSGSKR